MAKRKSNEPAEYVIARLYRGVFSVAKFLDGAEQPADTYQVDFNKLARGSCTCPSWVLGHRRPCKHIEMIAAKRAQLEGEKV